jgi:hypothetical protein
MRNALLSVVAVVMLVATKPLSPTDLFVGTWKGTSTCVGNPKYPACKNETVIYEVTRTDKVDVVTLKADKIVNGERQWMGDLSFTWSEEKKRWISIMESRHGGGVWTFHINGKVLDGTLEDPNHDLVRKIAVTKE